MGGVSRCCCTALSARRGSRIDRVSKSTTAKSAKPDPHLGDFDHRRERREDAYRRGRIEGGAGDHRRDLPEPDF